MAVHDERADQLVQLYLSFFSLYRIIEIGKPISKDTFDSIRKSVEDLSLVQVFVNDIRVSKSFYKIYSSYCFNPFKARVDLETILEILANHGFI
ncbi:hypothetical protein AXF42_Ash019458 [Apostasia shenzhenica]|uniref:Uncharacterized protein n=1 Tax=Apostasia shenzhenica TaxID=1088818 RepID=A0A2I0AYG0_9ASPA|nr:hypothetical protein AXF42_Ash019458 [Apostasia shenzhenica]